MLSAEDIGIGTDSALEFYQFSPLYLDASLYCSAFQRCSELLELHVIRCFILHTTLLPLKDSLEGVELQLTQTLVSGVM